MSSDKGENYISFFVLGRNVSSWRRIIVIVATAMHLNPNLLVPVAWTAFFSCRSVGEDATVQDFDAFFRVVR